MRSTAKLTRDLHAQHREIDAASSRWRLESLPDFPEQAMTLASTWPPSRRTRSASAMPFCASCGRCAVTESAGAGTAGRGGPTADRESRSRLRFLYGDGSNLRRFFRDTLLESNQIHFGSTA